MEIRDECLFGTHPYSSAKSGNFLWTIHLEQANISLNEYYALDARNIILYGL
jgi:hypothetical protein